MERAPDPDPDPTPFFIDFKNAKKIFFTIFLLLSNRHYFSPLNTLTRKGKDLEPDLYL